MDDLIREERQLSVNFSHRGRWLRIIQWSCVSRARSAFVTKLIFGHQASEIFVELDRG